LDDLNMSNLSNRLKSIADMVRFPSLVDIGSDHAYLPIYLLKAERIKKALAVDIAVGPLERGRLNAESAGFSEMIRFELADGLKNLDVAGFESLVIAGMGGENIMAILQNDMRAAKGFKQLILSPQRDAPALRRFLHNHGFSIVNEAMVQESGKFYNIIDCKPGEQPCYDEKGYTFGQILIDRACPTLALYIEAELTKFQDLRKYLKLLEGVLKCIK
jgi:tRNA (adenine22-N1)-methyltransferase